MGAEVSDADAPSAAEDGGSAAAASDSGDAEASTGSDGGDETPRDGDLDCAESEPNLLEPAPLRRLSHAEYARTLADLFPSVSLPTFELAKDQTFHGFENHAELLHPSALLVEHYQAIAEKVARSVMEQASEDVVPCDPEADPLACGLEFIEAFGRRAYRRPLTTEERETYRSLFERFLTEISFNAAVELTLQAFLQSPGFLYRFEDGLETLDAPQGQVRLSDYEMASRLSYFLWQSMPDEELFDLAEAGALHTAEDVEAQARRMLDDPRAAVAFADFNRQWLEFDEVLEQEDRNPEQFPVWNESLRASIREEALRFAQLVFETDATIAQLLTSPDAVVDEHVAELYGVAPPPPGQWVPTTLDPQQRAGLLTRAVFLASHARPTNGSPPLRGVAVLEKLLCLTLPPPPPDADTNQPMSAPGEPRTNRELFEERTSPPQCQGCHKLIDGVGMGFEAYDATGRFRREDNGYPVDASGELIIGLAEDVDPSFENAIELSQRLAQSEQVQSCLVSGWFQYALGRQKTPEDACKIARVEAALAETGGDLREALVAIATSHEFMHRPL